MKPHYICTGGCNGVSEKPGVCEAEDCPKKGQPLNECLCEDNRHDVTADAKDDKSAQ